jgi:hypothetical protein
VSTPRRVHWAVVDLADFIVRRFKRGEKREVDTLIGTHAKVIAEARIALRPPKPDRHVIQVQRGEHLSQKGYDGAWLVYERLGPNRYLVLRCRIYNNLRLCDAITLDQLRELIRHTRGSIAAQGHTYA